MHNPQEGVVELGFETNGAVVETREPTRPKPSSAAERYGFVPREKYDTLNTGRGLTIERRFTRAGVDPFDEVEWERRTAVITDERGRVVFEQREVETPAFWSQLATNVVVSKYFRGQIGTPERETSVRQVIGRVVDTLTDWGRQMRYFASDEDADAFRDELKYLLLHQYGAFNSPVWFNVGIEPRAQCSACQPYHALVNTLYGPMPIGEIVEKNLIGLPVWDGQGLTPVVAVKHNGRKPVYRVQLNDGFYVDATADHLVCAHRTRRTNRLEWQRVDALKPGMWMRVYANLPRAYMPDGDEQAVAEAALAGWLQADGFVGQYPSGTNRSLTIEFMVVGQEEFDWVMSHLKRVFPDHHYHIREVQTRQLKEPCLRIRLYGDTLRPFVEKYELQRRGNDIRVPRPIWNAPNNVVVAYLKSLFQADGYAAVHYPSAHIAFAVISRHWVEELQVLLTRFGIYARTRQKREKRPDRYDLWELDISIASERQKFAEQIGFVSESKQSRLLASLQVKGKRCPTVRYQQIASIEPLGEMEVYDIQTLSGCYLSNAVLVHNCFIVSVEDTMESILELAKTEGMIFKFGSGSGSNLSRLRGSQEYLSGGGRASGPVSFMRGFDAFAGVIKSGGKTRRAAKMVILNIDHPDIVEFIECKANEEKKAWALIEAGYDPGFNVPGGAYDSVFFQNANHSVRVTDEFMQVVETNGEWRTIARTTGEPLGSYRARDLFRKIAEAAWVCGDPGLQFHDATNRWHTVKNSGAIEASNPCFTGDSLVYTSKGLIPFREIIQRVNAGESFLIYTHNRTAAQPGEGVRLSEPTQWMITGVHEVVRLHFSNGIEVRCTPNHHFFTRNRGMVRADELTPEDSVLVTDTPCLPTDASWRIPATADWRQLRAKGERHAQLNLPAEWSPAFAELLGHLTGDGSFVHSSPMVIWIYGGEEEQTHLLPRHRAVLESLGLRPHVSQQVNGTVQMRVVRAAFSRFLESLGVRRAKAHDKQVPASIFQAPPEIVAAYLRGLFTADGCARDDQKKGVRYVGLGSKSRALLQQVQQLLLMFGVQSRIYTQPPKRASFRYTRKRDGQLRVYESPSASYDLRITGSSLRRFYEQIGFALPSKQQTLERWAREHRFYEVPVEARLVERVSDGYELTYNLTEPLHHTYIVNGLVVANCSEFVFLNDTSCNLASLNLMKFRLPDGRFDADAFRAAVRIFITAQEIIVDNSAYPTEKIADNSHNFRPLGLGYANLGALLMSLGLPYDSDAGRAYAALMTALMHGEAYRQSAIIARDCGAPFPAFELNHEPMLEVMRMHADALNQIPDALVPEELLQQARALYAEMIQLGEQHGYRNAQVTVLAPTGTISFLMDCDTTGIEPDIALVKYKTLVGGGMLKIVNNTVPLALEQLGYGDEEREAILRYIDEHDTIEGAPYLKEEHLPVFDCAFRPAKGVRSLAPMAHVKMMAAVQPFLSGAISKTVNMPHTATPEDIEQIYLQAWKLGLKAIAIYRDGSKRTQPLSTKKPDAEPEPASARPVRRRLPDERRSITHKFSVAGHEGYITVGMYEDGAPGEIFLTMAKEGSVISGLMDAFATAISLALQYGVPLEKLVEKFSYTRFQPSGFTNNPQIPVATSIVDYIFRWLGAKFLNTPPQPSEPLHENGVPAEALPVEAGVQGGAGETLSPHGQGAQTTDWSKLIRLQQDAPPCPTCGMIMTRSGACYQCLNCGMSFGCG
ncbi:MAG: hypothetical protein KatS3mg018_0322 [Fimbriimonadales bacterium]|nr:MAG: hypothetical protein KatS3mg018_0322 [Fimbriimonadales bacterium]